MLDEQFKLFHRFFMLNRHSRKAWVIILVLSGIGAILGLVNPYLSRYVVDKAVGDRDIGLFITLAFIGVGVFMSGILLDGARDWLERTIKLRNKFILTKKIYAKLQSLPLGWYKSKAHGEHLYRINYDVEQVNELVTSIPPKVVSLFPQVVLTFGIIFYLNRNIAILSFCLIPVLFISSYYFCIKMRQAWKKVIKNYEVIFCRLGEAFFNIHLVKAFGRESAALSGYVKMLILGIRLEVSKLRLELGSRFIMQIIGRMVLGLIVFYGIYQVIKGRMTLGVLVSIMIYLNQLMGLQHQFANFFQTIATGLVSCQRLDEILEAKEMIVEAKVAKLVEFSKPEVVFKEVTFGYKEKDLVLKGLSFSINPGAHIALVGPSGCGKSTVLNLMLRLYEPWAGQVLINGYNIKNLKLRSLKEQIGIALQEPLLWNDTIANNIRYGKEDAAIEEIAQAARLTGVDKLVSHLPAGYETVIGENACKLSEGQKQRIAIARALIKEPKILILDEAMSSMDSQSEEEILANIKEAYRGMGIIVVSHRLSAVAKSNWVYYLDSPGHITTGTAQELLSTNISFKRLFSGQNDLENMEIYGKT